MAAAFARAMGEERVEVLSGGSEPAAAVHETVRVAMAEVGIDLSSARPRRMHPEDVAASDVVVTMGCGDACPVPPRGRLEDWPVADPKGRTLVEVRTIREDIRARVRRLLADLGVAGREP